MEPVIELVRNQYEADYDQPGQQAILAADIRAAADEILAGLEGEALDADAPGARDQPPDGAAHPGPPLLHRPGRERAPPARAHRGRGEARRGGRPRPARRRPVPPLQRAADGHRRRGGRRRARARGCRPGRAREGVHVPPARLGRHGHRDAARIPVPRQLGLPRQVPPRPGRRHGRGDGRRRLAGRRGGHRAGRALRGAVRRRAERRHPRVPDDEPGVAGPVPADRGARHGRRRVHRAPGRARPRVRDPRGRGHVRRDGADPHGRPDPGRRRQGNASRSSSAPRVLAPDRPAAASVAGLLD